MNAIPVFSRHVITPLALQFILTPNASRISAPPHLLVILLLPCFATATPDDDAIIADVVLTLNVLNLSPPVPHVSTKGSLRSVLISIHTLRIAFTKPVISSADSPLTARAVKKAAL